MLKPTVKSKLRILCGSDPIRCGWTQVADMRGVDPELIAEWAGEGEFGPVYRIEAGGEIAWGYRSRRRHGFLVADTVSDNLAVYRGLMEPVTRRVIARMESASETSENYSLFAPFRGQARKREEMAMDYLFISGSGRFLEISHHEGPTQARQRAGLLAAEHNVNDILIATFNERIRRPVCGKCNEPLAAFNGQLVCLTCKAVDNV